MSPARLKNTKNQTNFTPYARYHVGWNIRTKNLVITHSWAAIT